MHPALINPFMFSDGAFSGSLPSGESEPSVKLAWAPSESRFTLEVEAFMAELLDEAFLQRCA